MDGDYDLDADYGFASTIEYKAIPYFHIRLVEWSLIFGISFLLGVGMGANDVADAFGTSIGSHTVTITQALILATIFEMMGALIAGFLGNMVKSLEIIDMTMYHDHPEDLILGQVASLIGCSVWLIVATIARMPVSTIHATLGGNIGFSLVLRGTRGIFWTRVAYISFVWLLSPFISGICTVVVFYLVDFTILRRKDPTKAGLELLPLFYAITFFNNAFLVLSDGSRILGLANISLAYISAISMFISGMAGLVALFVVAPIMKTRLKKEKAAKSALGHMTKNRSDRNLQWLRQKFKDKGLVRGVFSWLRTAQNEDDEDATRLFSLLQVVTACCSAFSYGADDIVVCVAPLYDLMNMYQQNDLTSNPLNTMLFVGMFVALAAITGIWSIGTRVINTVGTGISKINPATGFAVELGAAMTGVATNIVNVPQSNTQAMVGSIITLGFVRSGPVVHWKTVRTVVVSWALTFPITGGIAAASMYAFKALKSA